MADEPTPSPSRARRSSFAGQTFADLFAASNRPSYPRGGSYESNSPPPNANPTTPPSNPSAQQMPGPISQAAANANRRRLSLTTLGLSGSPNGTSPFGSLRGHRDSLGSSSGGSASIDESAIAEDDVMPVRERDPNNTPASPFARRSSFGAKALRDRMGSFSGAGGGGGGSPPASNGRSPPPAKSSGSNGTLTGTNGTISSRGGEQQAAKGRGLSLTLPSLSRYHIITYNLSSS